MRTARGETNFGGGSEGGQFCVDGALSLVCARNRSRKLAALTPPGVFASLTCFPKCSAVGMEQRPGALSLAVGLVRRAAAEWSEVGA